MLSIFDVLTNSNLVKHIHGVEILCTFASSRTHALSFYEVKSTYTFCSCLPIFMVRSFLPFVMLAYLLLAEAHADTALVRQQHVSQ